MASEIYFLRRSRDRADELLEAEERVGAFAEAVDDDLKRRGGPPLPCLMSFTQGKITHFGTLYVGNKAAEGAKRVNISDVEERAPIRTAALVELLPVRMQNVLREKMRRGGLIVGSQAHALIDAIRTFDPALADDIDRFERERGRVAALPERTRNALAIEKDMVGMAMSFTGLDRRELRSWSMPDDDGGSFLDGLPQIYQREDSMVVHDMQTVPGFDAIRQVAHTAAYFENGDARLTVVLANHLVIEEQLGADLLYFNETYKAMTLVQYKAMENSARGPLLRLPNRDLIREIERMDRHAENLRSAGPTQHCHGFRMLDSPFFLKLCPRIDFEPADTSMIKGMYLPLDYWKLLETDPGLVGPQGGRAVTFDNARRYFDNTGFISLVSEGWIGTTVEQSAMLVPVVRQLIAEGRPLAVAVGQSRKKPPSPMPTNVRDHGKEQEEQHIRLYRG